MYDSEEVFYSFFFRLKKPINVCLSGVVKIYQSIHIICKGIGIINNNHKSGSEVYSSNGR